MASVYVREITSPDKPESDSEVRLACITAQADKAQGRMRATCSPVS
jgi:hypothetical protein